MISPQDPTATALIQALEGVGQELRRARLAAGVSVREMARRVGLSASFVSQVELGRTKPSVGTLYSFATELGVPLDELMPVSTSITGQDPPVAPSLPWRPSSRLARAARENPAVEAQVIGRIDGSPVQRGDRRHELRMDRAVWGRLTADHDPDNDFLHVVYQPGGESCPPDKLIHHRGIEYGYLISGTLSVQVGFARYELVAGDSVTFESTTPHRLYNSGEVDSVSLWMVVGRGGTPVL
jgi:transcriptional regulator with XRE-family HTH domain